MGKRLFLAAMLSGLLASVGCLKERCERHGYYPIGTPAAAAPQNYRVPCCPPCAPAAVGYSSPPPPAWNNPGTVAASNGQCYCPPPPPR